jgi:hypothetical protein
MAKRKKEKSISSSRRRSPLSESDTQGVDSWKLPPNGLLVRGIDESSWPNLLKQAESGNFQSVNQLAAKVLTRLGQMPQLLEELAATGPARSSRVQIGQALEALAWAEHFFHHQFWRIALDAYLVLLNMDSEQQIDGITQFARYRSAFVLLEIASRYEYHGLSQREPSSFRASDLCVSAAIALQEEFRKHEPRTNAVAYNSACAWALRARLFVHSFLADDLHKIFVKTPYEDFVSVLRTLWRSDEAAKKCLGYTWRDRLPDRIELVDGYAVRAMDELERLIGGRRERPATQLASAGPPPGDLSFWSDRAYDDPDLLFLTGDREFRQHMALWKSRCDLPDRRKSILDMTQDIVKNLPSHTRDVADRYFRDAWR